MATAPQPPALPPPVPVGSTPLPPNSWTNSKEILWCNAYDECLRLEAGIRSIQGKTQSRILGYLLLHAPVDEGRTHVANEIVECGGQVHKLCQLAQMYQDHFLAAFRKKSLGLEFKMETTFFFGAIERPPTSHKAAKQGALRRDGFKSPVSGDNDAGYVLSCREQGRPIPEGPSCITNAVHIFPPSINEIPDADKPDPTNKRDWSSSVRAIIKCVGGVDVLNELDGARVHRLKNILTLDMRSNDFFDRLMLWFEPDPFYADNRHYIVHTKEPSFLPVDHDRRVMFVSADPEGVENDLPDPNLLKIHAAACRIALLSGAEELMDCLDGDI
ncbi:hypothetical protein BKA70DRAFT_1565470 [Coprinopsis sp. MPI-PUGE-AT-0042]|nr:hypothetical protein BKA70DRAFT_1565470 [Coprinopsis sp. MPI-PUGE-AT-0042]